MRRDAKPVAARVEAVYLHDVPEALSGGPVSTPRLQRLLVVSLPSIAATADTQSAEDGRYAFEGLGAGTWRLTAIAADGARTSATVDLPVDGARVEVDLAIGADAEGLRGRILHADGTAFRGSVFVTPAPTRASGPAWVQDLDVPATPVDQDGRFHAEGLARGDVVLHAVEPGSFRSTSGPVSIPRTDEFVWIVDKVLRLRVGSVVADDGSGPVAGALVLAGGAVDDVRLVAATTTDTGGAFAIRLAAAGGGVRASAPGFASMRKDLSELPAGDGPIVFRLVRGARVTGRVTEAANGRPVAGVRVRVIPDGRGPTLDAVVTSDDGRYTIDGLPAGEAVVLAEGNGWVSKGVAEVGLGGSNPFLVMARAGETITFDVVVVRTASVSAFVLDPMGAPVPGAVVASEPREAGGGYDSTNPLERLGERSARSNADGSFAIDGLVVGGTYVLRATRLDGVVCRSSLVVVAEGNATKVELRFSPERRITVTVLDAATGEPLVGAQATVWVPDERGDPDRASEPSKTGADGRATVVTHGAGELSADATADGYLDLHRFAQTPVPESGAVVIRLARGFVLSGRALLADGSPAAGATVEANPWSHVAEDPSREVKPVESDGAFRFTCSSVATRTVRARLGRGAAMLEGEATGSPDGPAIVVTLRPLAERKYVTPPDMLVVRVLDAEGTAVPMADAALHHAKTRIERDVLDGRVTFRRSDEESLSLDVWNARAMDGSPLPLGPARIGPVKRDARDLEIRLPAERTITGTVLGPDGKGVRGLVVRARFRVPSTSDVGREFASEARTDGDGAFRLGQLGGEECSLTVNTPLDLVEPAQVKARSGATDVTIRLRAAVRVSIRVSDEDGHPVVDAAVSARREGNDFAHSGQRISTDAAGVARLGGLDPSAAYVLEVDGGRDGWVFVRYARRGWTPRDGTIALTRGGSIRGVVRDPSGKPVAGAWVFADSEEWMGAPAKSGADGAFSIVGLTPGGRVALRASMTDDCDGTTGKPFDVGDEHVVLTIDPGLDLVVRVENWRPHDAGTGPSLIPEDGARPGVLHAKVDPDGSIRFCGLGANRTYTLWIPPGREGWALLRRGIHAATGELRVLLVRGTSITGRISGPDGVASRRVAASTDGGAGSVVGTVKPDGAYEIVGLPEGTWTVEAHGRLGTADHTARGTAPAGGVLDLELRPK